MNPSSLMNVRGFKVVEDVPIDKAFESVNLDNFGICYIDKRETIVHEFIFNYFDVLWNDINSIGKFYDKDATFSISTGKSFYGSLLIEKFGKYASNPLNNGGDSKIFYNEGVNNIGFLLKSLFPSGHFCQPESHNISILFDTMAGATITGYFTLSSGHVFYFCRSFIIQISSDSEIYITNEHLYIANNSSNKIRAFNKVEQEKIKKKLYPETLKKSEPTMVKGPIKDSFYTPKHERRELTNQITSPHIKMRSRNRLPRSKSYRASPEENFKKKKAD